MGITLSRIALQLEFRDVQPEIGRRVEGDFVTSDCEIGVRLDSIVLQELAYIRKIVAQVAPRLGLRVVSPKHGSQHAPRIGPLAPEYQKCE
jgi:hypothetical protein